MGSGRSKGRYAMASVQGNGGDDASSEGKGVSVRLIPMDGGDFIFLLNLPFYK
jgi:hypothetical protein